MHALHVTAMLCSVYPTYGCIAYVTYALYVCITYVDIAYSGVGQLHRAPLIISHWALHHLKVPLRAHGAADSFKILRVDYAAP